MNWKSLSWKIILLIIIGAVVFIWLVKAPVMSWYLTQKIGVPVSMSSVSMRSSQTIIHNFKIKNPREFKIRDALKVEKTTIDYKFKQLVGNPTVIDLIELDNVFLGIEFTNAMGSSNNWEAIGEGMPKDEQSQGSSAHEVQIHKIVVNNLDVGIRGGELLKVPNSKHIDRLEFDDVNSKTGFPTKELIRAIFQGAGIDQYIKGILNPTNVLQKIIPGIFGENEKGPGKSQAFGCCEKNLDG